MDRVFVKRDLFDVFRTFDTMGSEVIDGVDKGDFRHRFAELYGIALIHTTAKILNLLEPIF